MTSCSKTPPFAKKGQFLKDHSEKCPKMVIFNCDLWLKDASYGKKSKHKKSLELYFQQLLFYDVCSKTPPFARNGQFLRDHSEILIKTSGKLPP